MRLILVGPPGSGKGTQAKLLSERQGLVHVSTGDILRDAIRLGSEAGKRAEPFISSGRFVPDDLVNDVVAECFRQDGIRQFVMDGYPRTLPQAVAFDQVLRQQILDLTAVILLLVDDEEIVRRLSGRWSCPNPACRATYHVTKKPPKKAGICDLCQTPLMQRVDDREDAIRERLRLYHQSTLELIPHYRRQGLLHELPGEGGIDDIYRNITHILKRANGQC